MDAKNCMNQIGENCRLDNEPCGGICAQWRTMDKEVIGSISKAMTTEKRVWMTRRENSFADYYDLINSRRLLSGALSERTTNRSEAMTQSRLDVIADSAKVEPEHMLEVGGAEKPKGVAALF